MCKDFWVPVIGLGINLRFVVFLYLHRAVVRGAIDWALPILFGRADSSEVTLLATFKASSSFTILLLLFVICCLPNCCRYVHCIIVVGRETLACWLLAVSLSSLVGRGMLPIEIPKGNVMLWLSSLIRWLGIAIVPFIGLNFEVATLMSMRGFLPLDIVLWVVLSYDGLH